MRRVRTRILTKTVGFSVFCFTIALGSMLWVSMDQYTQDSAERTQENCSETARLTASKVQNDLQNLSQKILFIAAQVFKTPGSKELDLLLSPIFSQEKDLLTVSIVSKDLRSPLKFRIDGRVWNRRLIRSESYVQSRVGRLTTMISFDKLFSGGESIQSVFIDEKPVFLLAIPFLSDENGATLVTAVGVVKHDRLMRAMDKVGLMTNYLVDSEGYLLAHPEYFRVLDRQNFSNRVIVKASISQKATHFQKKYDQHGTRFFGAYHSVGYAGITAISEVKEEIGLLAAKRVQVTTVIVGMIVLIVLAGLVGFSSERLTAKIFKVINGLEDITASGKLNEIEENAHDETGALIRAYNRLVKSLKGRIDPEKYHQPFEGEVVTLFIGFNPSSFWSALEIEKLFDAYNLLFRKIFEEVSNTGGMCDGFQTQSLKIFWGLEKTRKHDLENCLMSALRLQRVVAQFNLDLAAAKCPPIHLRLSVAQGKTACGNLVFGSRRELGVLGVAVSKAALLSSNIQESEDGLEFSLFMACPVPERLKKRFVFSEPRTDRDGDPYLSVRGFIGEAGEEVLVDSVFTKTSGLGEGHSEMEDGEGGQRKAG